MRNKLSPLIVFIAFSISLQGQSLRLQENGTFNSISIKPAKSMALSYELDSIVSYYHGKTINYQFPFLTLVNGKDTLILDVRNITELRFTSSIAVIYYLGMAITGITTIGLLASSLENHYRPQYAELFFAGCTATLTIVQFNATYRTINTKTKWSFY